MKNFIVTHSLQCLETHATTQPKKYSSQYPDFSYRYDVTNKALREARRWKPRRLLQPEHNVVMKGIGSHHSPEHLLNYGGRHLRDTWTVVVFCVTRVTTSVVLVNIEENKRKAEQYCNEHPSLGHENSLEFKLADIIFHPEPTGHVRYGEHLPKSEDEGRQGAHQMDLQLAMSIQF
ncbi:hypothetical protein BKA67DRAFT_542083 [Truncatella angustata]|uniref:Uncharacterized protein n=1 Tax=Truncatella angustata TaxID=152316 RepID=A0A9P8RJ80_9PEZI|nr:uncharacterized protein BKA67DRAFT_542083 [Truncatella angustata]KAH6645106.1 hypothetical protein BKA67DRAFT_542083 [Truncatella angustata]